MVPLKIFPQWVKSVVALPEERGYYIARWSDKKAPAWFDPRLIDTKGQWILVDKLQERRKDPIEWLYDGGTGEATE